MVRKMSVMLNKGCSQNCFQLINISYTGIIGKCKIRLKIVAYVNSELSVFCTFPAEHQLCV